MTVGTVLGYLAILFFVLAFVFNFTGIAAGSLLLLVILGGLSLAIARVVP